jgi:ABC-type transport system substrate-binding protein
MQNLLMSLIKKGFLIVASLSLGTAAQAQTAAPAKKIMRYAIETAETTLDPQKVSDLYSNIIIANMFDAILDYDYLARPLKLQSSVLVAMPDISADGKTYTMKLKPGIYFTDDAAFNGKKRELVAEDFVFSMKRLMDPKLSAPLLAEVEDAIAGAKDEIARARKSGKFDYDNPMEGLKALDRYTLQIKLAEPSGTFIFNLADCRVACAVAREVVEKYGDDIGSHPVGTGPYRLVKWKRASKLEFEKNPNYREEYFTGKPNADDADGQAILARLKGKRLPILDRVEMSIIEEDQPRTLAFSNGEHDFLWRLAESFANVYVPNNKIAAFLKSDGIEMAQLPALDLTYAYFNMNDPTVGGYTPEKVALRRAFTLAYKTEDEIKIIRKNQAIAAHTPYAPGVAGYDPNFKTAMGEYNPSKANALLDMYGYKVGADGYRTMPDGSPLTFKFNSTPTARDKQIDELWKRSMDDIKVRFTVRKANWPDLLKESNAGKLQVWQLGGSASAPDADTWLTTFYGPNAGFKGNRSNFKSAEYDALYLQAKVMSDSPERTKIYQAMTKILAAYAPSKINTHRILTDLWYPWVQNFRRPPVQSQPFWRYIDIDQALLAAKK